MKIIDSRNKQFLFSNFKLPGVEVAAWAGGEGSDDSGGGVGDTSGDSGDGGAGSSDFGDVGSFGEGVSLGSMDSTSFGMDNMASFTANPASETGSWGDASVGAFGPVDYTVDNIYAMTTDPSTGKGWGAYGDYGNASPSVSVMESLFGKKGFFNTPFGKALTTIAPMVNPNLAPVAKGIGLVNSSINKGGAATFGSFAGGILGSALGGPFGGMVGSNLGSQLANSIDTGYTGGMASQDANNAGGGNLDNLVGLAGSLYQNNKDRKGIKGQIGNLENMYGPNSPYAQQMRQGLERRDAAAGRRSQYGPREVELQAALANAYSRNAPTLASLYQQDAARRNRNLQMLGYGYQQLGGLKGLANTANSIYNGLGSLFNGGGNASYSDPTWVSIPGLDSGGAGGGFQGSDWWSGGDGYWGE